MNALPDALGEATGSARPARAEQAYQHLRSALLEGPLGPGDALSVVALTRELGCSRVPVMEALKRLAGEGFVDIVPQVGCRVARPAVDEVRDFFTLFAAAEGTVAGFAAARRDAAGLAEFGDVCAEVDAGLARARPPGEPDPTYRRLNLLFHGCIHRLARSPVSTAIARGLWDRSDFYIKLAFGSLYFSRRVRAAHADMRAAIVAGNAAAAEAATRAHLVAVGKAVAASLAARDDAR
ncbi:MAG: GntR family transcriptional regulator [Gammaproteobacteria bacterium]